MTTQLALIPLDDSQLSQRIIPQVIRLLDPQKYALLLLRVAAPVAGLVGLPPRPISVGWLTTMYEHKRDLDYAAHPIYENQVEASESTHVAQTLQEEQRQLEAAGYSVAVEARFGDPAHEIAACAEERHVDLIAMATHGHTGWRHLVLGSVAEQVLRLATVPVLLVRPFEHDEAERQGDEAAERRGD